MSAPYPFSAPHRATLRQLVWRLDTAVGLIAMFAIALLVRVLIAPHAGFYYDLGAFEAWANRLAAVGPDGFYAAGQFDDYPPGYLYVLWLIGTVDATPGYLLVKLPAMVSDLALAGIAGMFAARLAPASLKERAPVRALVVAAVLFNPAVIALSAVWGQVDVVPTMFVLSSLLLLFTGRRALRVEIPAFLLFAVAVGMKPQSGFVFPVMAYALYRRYLHGRSGRRLVDGAVNIGVSGGLSLALWSVSGLAFGLGPIALLDFYSDSASALPFTSANAFNLWGAYGFWREDSVGGSVVTVAGISALHAGMLAFTAATAVVLWRLHRAIESGADEARALTMSAAAVSLLAFTLLTRMHERYMFLSLACLSPLVFARPLRRALALLSGLFILSLWYPYAYFNADAHVEDFRFNPWFDWLLGGFATDTWQKKVFSLAVTGIALALAWHGVRWVEEVEPGTRRLKWPEWDLRRIASPAMIARAFLLRRREAAPSIGAAVGAQAEEAAERPPRRDALVTWLRSPPVVTFLWSRAAIWFGALLAYVWFEPKPSPLAAVGDNSLLHDVGHTIDIWARWDSSWLLIIAEDGYTSREDSTAFFPLYPSLLRVLGRSLGGHYVLAGVLISLAAALGAFVLLYQLAERRLGPEGARRTVLYLAIFPMALFLQAVYTESLFLLLVLATFVLAERGRFLGASGAAGLAMLTRAVGVAVLVPLAYYAWRAPNRRRALGSLTLAPATFLVYPLFLWIRIGDPLDFLHAQRHGWGRRSMPLGPFQGLWEGLDKGLRAIPHLFVTGPPNTRVVQGSDPWNVAATNLQAMLFLVLFLALTVVAYRRLPRPDFLYAAASMLLLLASPSFSAWPLTSLPRYGMSIFPFFLALATIGARRRTHDVIVAVSAILLGIAIAQWVTFQWVG